MWLYTMCPATQSFTRSFYFREVSAFEATYFMNFKALNFLVKVTYTVVSSYLNN